MKRSSTFGLRLFTSAFLILFTFVQPLLAIESLTPEQDVASAEPVVTDTEGDILDEGISDPEEIAKPAWATSGESATTSSPVVVGETYTYPINPAVTVTFSKLPTVSSSLTIKTIYLTEDQVKATNAASDVAYDITTDMTDGSFEYDLTLPKVGDNTKVIYAENVSGLTDAKDIKNVVENGSLLKVENLNHFTVFVVTTPNPVATDCSASGLTVSVGDRCYNTIQEAVDSAVAGDTIRVNAGTYVLSSAVNMDTPNVTLMGIGDPVIQVSGTGYRFVMTANGNTISGFNIQKTDKTGTQDIIWINANDISVTNNQISGQFVIGDPEVSRAMVISGGHSGLLIQNNTIHNLRQPAYISGVTTGNILNNYVYSTKGWVVEQGNMTFANNTWGTGANTNVYDIAILSATSSSYYTDIASLSNSNNDAVIEDQRVSPAVLSDVYVDESTAYTSDLGGRYHPYSSIVPALARVAAGGTIHPLSDVHVASRFNISKALTLDGNNHSLFSTFTKTDNSNNAAISIAHDDVTLKNLTVDGISSTNLHGINIYVAKNILLDNVTVQNNDRAGIVVNGSTVTVNNITTSNNTWGGINVDLGGGVTSEAKLTVLGTSQHSEFKAIWMDDIRKQVSVIDTAGQYDSVDNGFTRILYLRIGTPINLGWNLRSTSSTPNESPLDLVCTSVGSVYTNENSVAQNWTSVNGINIKYQREVTFPTGGISYFEAGSITNTPFATFGSSTGIEGLWKTRVRAYIDANSNNTLDSNEGKSQWSNYCNITLDKTAPAKSTGLSFSDKGSSEVKMCGAKTSSHIGAVIHWDANTDVDFDHYEYRSFNADGSTGPLRTFTTNSFDASWWTVPMEGTYGFQVRAIDKAGNAGEWTDTCNIVEDWTAPDVTTTGIKYPNSSVVNKFVTSYNTPTIVGQILSSDAVSVELTINAQTYDATINGTNWEANVTNILPDGTYEMQIVATDDIGNSKTTTQAITIDTKAPTAVYTHYNNGVEVLGAQAFVQNVNQLTFTGTYSDATPSSELYWDSFVIFQAQDNGTFAFSQNGKQAYCSWRQNPNLVELSGNPFTLTTQRQFTDCVTTLPEGTYYMTHQVYDNATRKDIPTINQFRDVLGLKFTVDTTVPVSQFTGNDLSGSYNNSPIVISGTSTDANGVVSVAILSRPVGSSGDWTIIETIPNSSASNTFTWSTTWEPSEGRYDIKAEATDQAGNTEHSPMMSNIVYDTTNPRVRNVDINIDYFGKYVNGQTGFLISVPVSDTLSGIDRNTCEYSLDGRNWSIASYALGNCGIWIDNDRLFDGQDLLISLAVKDKAGNISTSSVVSREVDTANATSSVNPLNPFYGPNSLPTISGTASDTVSDIKDVKIRMTRNSDSKNWIGTSIWSYIPGLQNVNGTDNWVLSRALPSMSNGVTYTVTPYASDEVHGLSAGRSDSFIWDSEVPQNPTRIWSTSHNATPNDDTTIDMRFTGASDNLSGVKGYYYSFSQTPETPSINPMNWLNNGANRVTSRRLADGVWYFNIITVDNVNNVSNAVSSIAYTIDTQAPNARITAPTATYLSGDVEIKGTVTDVNPHTYSLNVYNLWNRKVAGTGNVLETNSFIDTTIFDLDTTELSDGIYTLRLESRDAAGNQDFGSIDWKMIVVDNTQPSVDLVFETPGESNKGFKAVFSENVNEAEAENPANYFLNNWPTAGGSGDLVDDANITYNWRTRTATITFTNPAWYISPEQQWGVQNIHDLAGNILSENPRTEYSTPMVAPITTISETSSDWYNTDVTVTLTCADINGSGCYLTHYSLNNGESFEIGNQVLVSTEGENTIIFYSEDRAGNIEERQTSEVIKIDKTNPDLAILNPSVTLPIAGTFTIDGTVSDTLSGVNKVTVDFGNGTTAEATLGSSSTLSLDVNDGVLELADGAYDVTVTAEDNSGNTTVETLADLVIDNTNPTAQVLSALSFTTGDTTPRSLALSDNTQLSQVCYVIDTNTQTCLPLFGIGYSWNITDLINTLSVGTHTFTYYVVDTAGNRSDSNTIVEGNDPYAASVVVAAVPQQAVRGAATVAEVTPEAVQGVQTVEEETTSPVTQEEVKGAQDSNDEETNGKPIPWWVYVIGGAALLSFIIFLIARRRKEEEEKENNIR